MKLDINKLTKYDLSNAKVEDKVIIAKQHIGSRWFIEGATIKSISPKRRDITFNDRWGTKVDRHGRKMGASAWDTDYYIYLENSQENIAITNSYTRTMNEAKDIVCLFRKIEEQGFKMLYDLPEDKISVLHKTLQEIFGAEND